MTTAPTLSVLRYFAICMAVLSLCYTTPAAAQDRCGTVEYSAKLLERKNVLETPEQFEQWLRTSAAKSRRGNGQRPMDATYRIPVVVHVIHNGESAGSGPNITEAQINSQIATLNRDYQRNNPDAGNTPAEFAAVAGSLDIEFVLAKQDPEGLATTGIVRINGHKTEWTMNDNYQLKSLSYWPAEDYLNLWVCNLTDYLGYAQFPVSTLPGLENSSNNRATDGVVIAHYAFGSTVDGAFPVLDPQYNKGRTATHEVGHFLGLRHIWGDDHSACGNVGDYVDDTPDQGDHTLNCPAHPTTSCTGINKMFQNFMDYTDDQCMNLFTEKQMDRMVTVLENSNRRFTLLTSHGLNAPAPVPNDAGIRAVLAPQSRTCDPAVIPSIEVRNYGSNAVTTVRVQLKVNSIVKETKTVPVTMGLLETEVITFANIALTPGVSTFSFSILQTNGGADSNPGNNIQEIQTDVPVTVDAPFIETFDNLPTDWRITDPDNFIAWTLTTAPDVSPTNKALYMNFYDYEDGEGEIDILTTPVINLTGASLAVLYFDIAYSPFNASKDGLKIYVLKDCKDNIYEGELIYNKSGTALATTAAPPSSFVPNEDSDWRKEAINLGSFIDDERIQLAFVGVNDWGNNLYLDNIAVLTSQFEDIALRSVTPALVTCEQSPAFEVTVRNAGTLDIHSFDLRVQALGKDEHTQTFSGVTLEAGGTLKVTLDAYKLDKGQNTVSFDVLNPNGNIDVNSADNHEEKTLVVNDSYFAIPYRESFEGGVKGDWTLVSPTKGMQWQTQPNLEHFGTSAYYDAFDNAAPNDEAWLISPVFNFKDATMASLQFYSSYAVNELQEDRLRVLYSKDCGNTFHAIPLFDKSGDGLSPHESTAEWIPRELSDWQHRVLDLSTLAGEDNLRFAFVATNAHGNNIYIDNINFSPTTEPNPLLNEQLYVIYQKRDSYDFYLTFNLPEKQTVQYDVVDAMGRTVLRGAIDDVLNQTYPFSLGEGTAEGVYIVRLGIASRYYSNKLFIGK